MSDKICFLLVEDDLDDQEIFQMCLKNINQDIICRIANEGEEAINMLRADLNFRPDVIFIDVNMPRMNGIECLNQIKQMDHLKASKVFMYSTTSEKGVLEKTKTLGAEEFIIKPTKTSLLKDKLSAIYSICLKVNEIKK
jgi:CheY-like chemotaxis protein